MLIYRLPEPRHDGQALLRLAPAEFLNRMAILIPPPRRHRHRYHGVFAPNAPLREQVAKRAGLPVIGEKAVSGFELFRTRYTRKKPVVLELTGFLDYFGRVYGG